jgi:TonB family protein
MSDIVKAPRRWPWILGIIAAFVLGAGGGLMFLALGMALMFNVSCPAVFQPRAGDNIAPLEAGPGVFQPQLGAHPLAFPRAARVARVRGTVTLLAYVGTNGAVLETRLLRSSGFCPFDIEALKDVKLWHFIPGMRQGTPVESWKLLTIDFGGGTAKTNLPAVRGTDT